MTGLSSTSGRLHSEFIRLLLLQDHRETDRFFRGFRSSASGTKPWTIPLPPRGVLGPPESKSRQHPRQGWNFTYQLKYWWGVYHYKNTYLPITLANISSMNLVFIGLGLSIHNKQRNWVFPLFPSHLLFLQMIGKLTSFFHLLEFSLQGWNTTDYFEYRRCMVLRLYSCHDLTLTL